MVEKTLDNLEVDDIVVAISNEKYRILAVVGNNLLAAKETDDNVNCYVLRLSRLKTSGWRVEQPLGPAEKAAKTLLEKLGFKVTR